MLNAYDKESDSNVRIVAEERKIPVMIPMAVFIENEKHYRKYKCRKDGRVLSMVDNKSQTETVTHRSFMNKIVNLNATTKQNIKKYYKSIKH